jgi:integrase
MPSQLLTARWVQGVAAPEHGQVEYFDSKIPGFALRVTSAGVKSWTLVYRYQGRVRRWTLGRYPDLSLADARDKAADARRDIAHGGDPAGEKQLRRHAPTVADIVQQYLTLYAKVHKRSWRQDTRIFQAEVLPHWGTRPASSITRREVLLLLDTIMERQAPVMANRLLAVIRKMYNWAISRDLVEHNPCLMVPAPGKEQARDRVLTLDEVRQVWEACAAIRAHSGAIFQLQILTAQRVGEVRLLRWEDIDGLWWTIPASVAKNGMAHRVPLSPLALEILEALRPQSGQLPWVFPGTDPRKPLAKTEKVFQRVRALSGVDFRTHDLRRTAASHMTSMGIPRLVVSKILNHTEPGVTRIYDRHSYDLEKQDALHRWGERVQAILAGETGRVLSLRREMRA